MSINTANYTFSMSDMVTETPVLPSGIYASVINKASVEGKDGKNHLHIAFAATWNDKTKKYDTSNEYILGGNSGNAARLYWSGTIISEQAKKILMVDTPSTGSGRLNINFTRYNEANPGKSFIYDLAKNVQMSKALQNLDIRLNDVVEKVLETYTPKPLEELQNLFSFVDYTPSAEELSKDILPLSLLAEPFAEILLNNCLLYRAVFNLVGLLMVKQKCGVVISRNNKDGIYVNEINTFNQSPGFITYKENMEFDTIKQN